MDRRTDAVELLDGPLDDLGALAGNLRDLGRINRHLGGVDLSATAIDALAAHVDALTLLDVGTGGADIPMALIARARDRGRRIAVIGLDSRPEVLEAAVLATPALATTDGLELHVGDGTALPYGDRSFDV
ncbi:MAG TPA: methyltransferase domain-containing protein, partial [Candidatus Limnocylindrales bacterium]|nr:methyltransferase domain-containing protein [Candidatus Limnocylindrales bacterium]